MFGPFFCDSSEIRPEVFLGSLLSNEDVQKFLKNLEEVTKSKTTEGDETQSTIRTEQNKFAASLNVQHYAPDEISVKISGDNIVVVEGKQGDKEVDNGTISRTFMRKFVIPEGHDIEKVETQLSSDGILKITVPKVRSEENNCRAIPIQRID